MTTTRQHLIFLLCKKLGIKRRNKGNRKHKRIRSRYPEWFWRNLMDNGEYSTMYPRGYFQKTITKI